MKLASPYESTLSGFIKSLISGAPTAHKDVITLKEFNERLLLYNVQCMLTSVERQGLITGNMVFVSDYVPHADKESGWDISEIQSWLDSIYYGHVESQYYAHVHGPHTINIERG